MKTWRRLLNSTHTHTHTHTHIHTVPFQQSVCRNESFIVLTAVKIQIEVFWVVTPCSVAVVYSRFVESCCLCFQTGVATIPLPDRGSMDLRNVGILPQHYTASQPRRSVKSNSGALKWTVPPFPAVSIWYLCSSSSRNFLLRAPLDQFVVLLSCAVQYWKQLQ